MGFLIVNSKETPRVLPTISSFLKANIPINGFGSIISIGICYCDGRVNIFPTLIPLLIIKKFSWMFSQYLIEYIIKTIMIFTFYKCKIFVRTKIFYSKCDRTSLKIEIHLLYQILGLSHYVLNYNPIESSLLLVCKCFIVLIYNNPLLYGTCLDLKYYLQSIAPPALLLIICVLSAT